MLRVSGSLALGLTLSFACGEKPLEPTRGDRVPEVSVSGAKLRQTFRSDGDYLISKPLATPDRATVAGFMVDLEEVDAPARFEARGIDPAGVPGEWVVAEETWAEDELRVLKAQLDVAASEVEIRIRDEEAANVRFVVWSAVVPMPARAPLEDRLERGGIRFHRSALEPAIAAAGVKSRADWNARPTQCNNSDPVKTRMAVHHTVTPSSSSNGFEARIRQIQSFHMDTRGWCDVGYHFLVTIDGTVWEARETRYMGAHVSNHNANNAGVSFIGCFHPGDATCDNPDFAPNVPPQVMIDNAGVFIGVLARHYGITINSTNIKGHRDHSGASTSCPGDALHSRLPELLAIAEDAEPPPTTGSANGVVWDLSITDGPSDPGNIRITDATINCSCGQSTTVRASDAFWKFDLEPGLYTFTAEAPGFASSSTEIMVVANDDAWSSIGLAPEEKAVQLILNVTDSDAGAPVEGAEVSLSMVGVKLTDADGSVTFDLAPGRGQVTVVAEGFEPLTQDITYEDPAGTVIDLVLERVTVTPPKPTPKPPEPEMPIEQVDDQEPDRKDVTGGCGCSAHRTDAGKFALWPILALIFLWNARVRRRDEQTD